MLDALVEREACLDALDVLDLIALTASREATHAFAALAGAALDAACSLDDAARRLLEAGVAAGQHDENEVAALLWELGDAIAAEVTR
jgi:hypothetical protein